MNADTYRQYFLVYLLTKSPVLVNAAMPLTMVNRYCYSVKRGVLQYCSTQSSYSQPVTSNYNMLDRGKVHFL